MNMQYAQAVVAHERAYRERSRAAYATTRSLRMQALFQTPPVPSIDPQIRMAG
jgi:hypothetical protein